MSALPACISMYYVCTLCPQGTKEDAGSPGIGIADICKVPCAYWELD